MEQGPGERLKGKDGEEGTGRAGVRREKAVMKTEPGRQYTGDPVSGGTPTIEGAPEALQCLCYSA